MVEIFDLERHSGRPALVSDQLEIVGYDQLLLESGRIEEHLTSRTLAFILCKNVVEAVAGYVACLRKGVVAVLLGHRIHEELLKNLIDAYRPAFFYVPSDRVDCEGLGVLVFQGGAYRLLRGKKRPDYEIHSDIALLMSTSGSTGSPKFVKQTYANLNSNAHSICGYLNVEPSDRAITTMPMSYAYGLSILNTHLLSGASTVLTELSVMQRKFWDLFRSAKVNNMGGVPYSYQLLKRLKFSQMELPTLKYLTQAGGRLDPELVREFSEICRVKGGQFFTMYGQTEATARMSYLDPAFVSSHPDSIGKPVSGGRFWLEDDSGGQLEDPEIVGELVYEGPNVSYGYAESWKDLAVGDVNHGVLRTGDLAKRSKDDFYFVVGRKKRFVKIFGNRVNLDEIEKIAHGLGVECACVGFNDKLHVYSALDFQDRNLSNELSEITGIHPTAIKLHSISEIPRSDSGKILYARLGEEFSGA